MPTFEEARNIVLESVASLGAERVETGRALGRTLAEDVSAPWSLPFCDNSAMDGYAVRAGDCRGPARLKITGYIPAGGTASVCVEPGCAVKIMTGAPIPAGCDAVIPFEETEEGDGHVGVTGNVTVRQHIRFRGEDVREGDLVLPEGTPLRPAEISMLASLGKAFVPVYRKVRVAVLSTGDELIELGEPPSSPGMIINSNSVAIAAAVRETGAEPVLLGIARDDLSCHAEKIREGLKADALVTTAGVSAGDRDLVREVLAELGVVSRFFRVDIKPGGPTAFGMKDGVPVFSLPGNPVSALITFEAFVRPALLRMMGRKNVVRPLVKATLTGQVRKKAGKVNFLRVGIEVRGGEYFASSAGDQNTGILRTMVLADALAVLPADKTTFAAGETVDVFLLGETVR
ncbi:MAG: molybdopterin molybdenumtransferase MoeA [Deltaproteobacteria bacterium]|nr:MAG: molybdopterin molybdenumtransferase MoeA [Deltaproteobacteria bacterium]